MSNYSVEADLSYRTSYELWTHGQGHYSTALADIRWGPKIYIIYDSRSTFLWVFVLFQW